MSNLIKRTVFGLVYVGVIVASTLIWPVAFLPLAILALYGMMKEFYRMSMGDCWIAEQKLAIFSAFTLMLTLYLYLYCDREASLMLIAAIPLIAMIVMPVFRSDRTNLDKYAFLFTGLVYIGLPLSLSPLLIVNCGTLDGHLLLYFFIVIWLADMGAYCLGSLLGQKPNSKKLAPSISPKKSWWGFAGALICGTAASVVLSSIGFYSFPSLHAVALGLLISAGSVVGDLVESVWKRFFSVKDSGNLIPGHGGLLDRLDSSLIAMPLATIYLIIFNLI